MSESFDPNDWGNVRIRRRGGSGSPLDPAAKRFWIGLSAIVALAIASPWYGYWVVTYLISLDAQRAIAAANQQLAIEAQQADDAAAAARDKAMRAQAQAMEEDLARRIDAVRVMGASANSGRPVVIVSLGTVTPFQAVHTICDQSAQWLGNSTKGQRLQVQAYRGAEPAISIGIVDCP